MSDDLEHVDRVAELVADGVDAVAVAILREEEEGRPPRTALAFLAIAARARPELLRPPPAALPPQPLELEPASDYLTDLLADLERAPTSRMGGGRRRR